uniref:MFS domain-containing protein n=1 Tax=Meloidogyne floridensis TaxID=298350 RepID=A0A915P4X5_9BILA
MFEHLLKLNTNFFKIFTHREWAIISTLLIANFVNTITFNCMDAFYPKEIIIIGTSKSFFFSLFLTAFTAFGFGLLTLLPNGLYFFWASLAIRIVQALARTVFVISSLTIMAQIFPANITLLGGLLEAFAGFGYISGPVIGSVLFEFGGFITPNFTFGTLMALTGMAFAFSTKLKKNKENKRGREGKNFKNISLIYPQKSGQLSEESSNSSDFEALSKSSKCSSNTKINKTRTDITSSNNGLLSVLRLDSTWLIMLLITTRGITCSFFQAPLPEHLNSLNSSAVIIGTIYTIMSVSYFMSAPIWGLYMGLNKKKCQNSAIIVTIIGSILAFLSTFLMGPFPFLPIQKTIPLISVSFALLGCASAALYIPVFQLCSDISKSTDEESTRIYACLFGLVQSSSTLGSFAGNILGGFGAQKLGFAWTCSIISFSHFVFIFIIVSYSLLFKFNENKT